MRRHHISFLHAWQGLITAVTTQPNFRVHIILSLLAVSLGIWLKIGASQWALLSFTIATGLAIELLNTAIEFTVDLLTDTYHILAKYAKDTAAAAMLIYALGAVCVAVAIFLPKLILIWPYI